jgi:hypothetical protein
MCSNPIHPDITLVMALRPYNLMIEKSPIQNNILNDLGGRSFKMNISRIAETYSGCPTSFIQAPLV